MRNGTRRALAVSAVTATALLTLAGQADATARTPYPYVYGKSHGGCSEAAGTYNYYDTNKRTQSGKRLFSTAFDIRVKDLCPRDPQHNAARLYIEYWQYSHGLEQWHGWHPVKTNGTYRPQNPPNYVWDLKIRVCDWNPTDGTLEWTCNEVK
ncbi:hypothetical protein [Streptomyces abikoensis]|uniref:hypothetical protein n=1 Tax=Streptomyces abikoensis TaxID=97398 RepID=UPI001675ECD0|nr:hypothetical protein [Streptomyces abikoensis]GGP56818.1 hypothetical protein GCM10010214_32820 [Streptomyces abikoensis]